MSGSKKGIVGVMIAILAVLCIGIIRPDHLYQNQITLWESDEDHQYRIPGIVCSSNGTVIAYCEQRSGLSDWSAINIVVKVSRDAGDTWSDDITVADDFAKNHTVNNPVMIADKNAVHLLFEVEYGLKQKNGGIFYCKSLDEGDTWSKPVSILENAGKTYNVIATGPGHGIITSSGRLIVPVWAVRKDSGAEIESHHPGTVLTIYSDDHGKTWEMGGEVPQGDVMDPNESSIVELKDGTFLMNIRNQVDYGHEYRKDKDGNITQEEMEKWNGRKYRAFSHSAAGIDGWDEMAYDYTLKDPICFGSMCPYDETAILFVNCDSQEGRDNLTMRRSSDGGNTWDDVVLIAEKGGYADIAVNEEKMIFCLAESAAIEEEKVFHDVVLYRMYLED